MVLRQRAEARGAETVALPHTSKCGLFAASRVPRIALRPPSTVMVTTEVEPFLALGPSATWRHGTGRGVCWSGSRARGTQQEMKMTNTAIFQGEAHVAGGGYTGRRERRPPG